ncbi:hypothetical protein [Nostoc parmelioides]|uniref:Transposase n=1 Tax=Nostoc parmelioides FACHB-3921 TaxID=2692909 RepID=A0ABR8BHM8_9NOSO|nr:hypothetical protein [Nostoc parmelioides]MBD2253383.1 hypothetical protein [Nostoc parmelioides FACHB-3921]
MNTHADLVDYTLNVSALYLAHFVVNGLSRRSRSWQAAIAFIYENLRKNRFGQG